MHTKRIWLLLTLLVARRGGVRPRRLRRLGLLGLVRRRRPTSSSCRPATSASPTTRASRWSSTTSARGADPATPRRPTSPRSPRRRAARPRSSGSPSTTQQSDVVDFMSKYGLTYPVVLDDDSLSAEDGITGVPTTIFYDAERPGGGPHRRRGEPRPVHHEPRQDPVSPARICASRGARL